MSFARSLVAATAILAVFASATASKKYAEKKYAEKEEVCYAAGERCAGAKGKPYVKYAPCCDKEMQCVVDKKLGWGRFCKKPSSKYWEKCYLNGSRCLGAPGKPYVEYHKCCGKGECVEDKELGWGSFCKGGKYNKKYEKVYKKATEEYKKEDDKDTKMYKGHFYESKDGEMKYEKYSKKYESEESEETNSYSKSYGYGKAMHKGKGQHGKKFDSKLCKLGGAAVGPGCFDTAPMTTDDVIYTVSMRIPDCKYGEFPCTAARALLNQICELFSFASTRRCYLLSAPTTLPSGLMLGNTMRQVTTAPPVTMANSLDPNAPTLSPTTTASAGTTAAATATTVAADATTGFRFVTGQIYIKCSEYTPAIQVAADLVASRFFAYSKNDAFCTTPQMTP